MVTTVDLLLNSLHTHLTSQTPIIPVLHAQLGLPPTALTDELGELHSALVDCVDRKIEDRRKEVGEWMEKCSQLEGDSLKLARALGSHAKVVAGSVGELRKEQVRRMINDLARRDAQLRRDKLQQLFKTKLEQLSVLTNKINALTHIVGDGFFGQDITSLTPAQGTQSGEEMHALRDVTPERFSRLEKELVRAKGEITRRLAHLSQTFLQVGWLHEELGIPLPTDLDIPRVARSLSTSTLAFPSSVSSSAPDPFLAPSHMLAAPTPNTSAANADDGALASYHLIFGCFVARLQEASDESLDLDSPGNETFGVEGVEPTVGLMKWAKDTKMDLEDLKSRREAHIQAIYNELDTLWRRLGVDEAEMDAFIEANRGSTEANVHAYEAEHERMLELKRESMSVFIKNARAEIDRLWDELILGEDERGSFAPFVDEEHTEELLALHETEIQRLKEERRIKAPLLAAIKKYFEICEEEKDLAAAASDQSRLLGRGARDPGRLLREEKMRKRVMKEKPRLEKDLMVSIPTWEDEYRRPFLVNGVSIVEILAETMDAAEAGKENRKRAKGGMAPPRGMTPQPVGARTGAATPIPYTQTFASSQSVPNKRPRLGNSNVLNTGPAVRPNSVTPTFGYGPPSSSPHKPFGNNSNTPPRPCTVHTGGVQQKPGKTPTSSLPRPIPSSKHGHHGYQYGTGHGPGHGYHVPGYGGMGVGMPRIPSNASVVSGAGFSIFSGGRTGNRRESFKPRPSVDGPGHDMGASASSGGRQWAGFVGRTVKEEDER